MIRAAALEQIPQRVDRLLRSLVGVVAVRAVWDGGTLRKILILKDDQVADHQLIGNVVSGLKAGFGIQLDTSAIHVHDDVVDFGTAVELLGPVTADDSAPAGDGAAPAAEADAAEAPVKEPAVPAATNGASTNGGPPHTNGAPAPSNGFGADVRNGNGRGADTRRAEARAGRLAPRVVPAVAKATNGHASGTEPVLELERLEMERHGAMLRCRVVLALDGHTYSAIAEVPPHGPAAEAELAARVTLDAMRAGALTAARLDGIGFTQIGDTTYLVAAVRDPSSASPRASAAPLMESMARSATEAVLNVIGPITAVQRRTAERQLGRL